MTGQSGLKQLRRTLATATEHLAGIVFPRRCLGCSELLEPGRNWCSQCWTALAIGFQQDYCRSCGRTLGPHQQPDQKGRCPQCRNEVRILSGIARLGPYDGVLSAAIRQFKYQQQIHTGYVLAEHLANVLADQPWFEQLDLVVPVPTHWFRRWTKGFSHSRLLAEHISEATMLPMLFLIRCIKLIRPQVGLPATARAENVKDAFKPIRRFPVEGATVCLIDDVMTTGSTLREAARALLAAGAAAVYAGVIARAEIGKDQ